MPTRFAKLLDRRLCLGSQGEIRSWKKIGVLFIVPGMTCWIRSHRVKLVIQDPLKVAGSSRVAVTRIFSKIFGR
jgi:hypothetical protein